MKAYFQGPMPNDDLFQLLWEFRHNCIDRHAGAVKIKEATLTVHFCDGMGRIVPLYNEHGHKIDSYRPDGAYQPAADYYDAKSAFESAQTLEPEITTTAPPSPHDVPFSPI